MKTVLAVATLLAFGLMGSGCKRSPSIVGKWNGTILGMAGTFDFAADEKATVSVTTAGGQINLLGEYKVEKDEFTLNLTDVQTPGQDARGAGMVKQSLAGALNKPVTMQMAFVSPDEVSFTQKKPVGAKAAASTSGSMTLKRVKEGS